jgi:hypothetical protein
MSVKQRLVGSPWNINTGRADWYGYSRDQNHATNVSGIRLVTDTLAPTASAVAFGGNWLESGPRHCMGSEDQGGRSDKLADLGIRLVFDVIGVKDA